MHTRYTLINERIERCVGQNDSSNSQKDRTKLWIDSKSVTPLSNRPSIYLCAIEMLLGEKKVAVTAAVKHLSWEPPKLNFLLLIRIATQISTYLFWVILLGLYKNEEKTPTSAKYCKALHCRFSFRVNICLIDKIYPKKSSYVTISTPRTDDGSSRETKSIDKSYHHQSVNLKQTISHFLQSLGIV